MSRSGTGNPLVTSTTDEEISGVPGRREVLDTVPGPVLEIDENLIILLANRAAHSRWETITEGITPFHDLFFPGKPHKINTRCILAETFRTHNPQSADIETAFSEVFSVKTNFIETENGPARAVVYLEDVSQRAELAKKLERIDKKHYDQLLQADKMISLGILASGMAHEINNPNNSIMLNVSVLKKAWNSVLPILDEFHRERGELRVGGMKYPTMKKKMPSLFSGLIESSKKIQRIVNDLKHFSGKDVISIKSQVDMEAVVQSAISLTGNMIHKSTRRFKSVYEKNLPSVMGNFQNLEQVVINLIQNACHALENPENGLFVTITCDHVNREIVTAVKDEGKGIPAKDIKYITEPFFTTRRSSGGTGLGLYMSSKIIRDHGGTLRFFSEPGKGTAVQVRLPALDNIL